MALMFGFVNPFFQKEWRNAAICQRRPRLKAGGGAGLQDGCDYRFTRRFPVTEWTVSFISVVAGMTVGL